MLLRSNTTVFRTKQTAPRYHTITFSITHMKINTNIIVSIVGIAAYCLSFHVCNAQESNFNIAFNDPLKYSDVIVQEVESVDTIIIDNYLQRGEKIKLIGLKAPEPPKKKTPVERDKYGFAIEGPIDPETSVEEQAFDFVKDILKGQHVRLEFDTSKTGSAHKTLAYVYLLKDNTFVNAKILEEGYADLQIEQPNTKYVDQLRRAYQKKKKEKRGIHSDD